MTTMPYNYSYNSSAALTNSLRASVSRSKQLSAQQDKLNVALGTGKSVNTPYDDSIRFFKDAHLSEKAQSIVDLLDNISMVTSTLNSTDDALTTLSELIDLAKGAALKAQQTPDDPARVTGNIALEETEKMTNVAASKAGDVISMRLGDADEITSAAPVSRYGKLSDFGIKLGEDFSVKIGQDDWVDIRVTNENMTLNSFMKEIVTTLGEDRVEYEFKNNQLTLSTTDQSSIMFGNRHYDPLTQEIDPTDTTDTAAAKLGFATETLVTVDADDTVKTFMDKINAIDGYQASLDKHGYMIIESTYGDDIVVTDFAGKTASSLGVADYSKDGKHVRADEAKNYNQLLDQINELVKDSIFDGVNLLAGDNIRAVFNETATDYRQISGVNLDTDSMGLVYAQDSWSSADSINDALTRLESAVGTVRQATEYFDRANAMVSSRENFLTALSETFQAGADSLTKADLNEVSSQLLALDTQRSIASQVISLTLEIDSDVLSLF